MVISLRWSANILYVVQLIPLPPVISCSSKAWHMLPIYIPGAAKRNTTSVLQKQHRFKHKRRFSQVNKHFCKTKVEMLKFAALMAKCLSNNLWKVHQKILNYSKNNQIFVGGCFFATPCSWGLQKWRWAASYMGSHRFRRSLYLEVAYPRVVRRSWRMTRPARSWRQCVWRPGACDAAGLSSLSSRSRSCPASSRSRTWWWWWFYLYGSQLAGLVYKLCSSNAHTKVTK